MLAHVVLAVGLQYSGTSLLKDYSLVPRLRPPFLTGNETSPLVSCITLYVQTLTLPLYTDVHVADRSQVF